MGAALAEVAVPTFQPKQDVMIATDDASANDKAAVSNGVDDQRAIELLVEKLQVSCASFKPIKCKVIEESCA